MCKTTNGEYCGTRATEIQGMIDGNTLISGAKAITAMSGQIDQNRQFINNVNRLEIDSSVAKKIGVNAQEATIDDISRSLIEFNTKMYNERMLNRYGENARKTGIKSLVVASTLNMWLAHIMGYEQVQPNGENKPTQGWHKQIDETVKTVLAHPLQLFPLFSYDPRQYNYSTWNSPFKYVVGYNKSNTQGIWLGFCMNPLLGFRPFDEFCERISQFYEECAKKDIPILAHCATEGITTFEAMKYRSFDVDNDGIKGKASYYNKGRVEQCMLYRKRDNKEMFCSNNYRGTDDVTVVNKDSDLSHFLMNYGHPRNWIPVLEHCRDPKPETDTKTTPENKPKELRLCLAGFGGNYEWGHEDMSEWNGQNLASLPREWIRCIIKLTAKYPNVYADISGLDISEGGTVRKGLEKMLMLILQEHTDFKHLKYKLIFGSGWYLIEQDYSKYCDEFKSLFCVATGENDPYKAKRMELWERISLINPWKFYGFDKNVKALHENLKTNIGKVENAELKYEYSTRLEYMERMLIKDSDALIKYIEQKTEKDPHMTEPDDTIGDLVPNSLCSIFKNFRDTPDMDEINYCFKKFHEENDCCKLLGDTCKQLIDGKIEKEFFCAHKRGRLSTVVNDLLETMGAFENASIKNAAEKKQQIELMKQQIMENLYVVRLHKEPTPHQVLKDKGNRKFRIELNIKRGLKDNDSEINAVVGVGDQSTEEMIATNTRVSLNTHERMQGEVSRTDEHNTNNTKKTVEAANIGLLLKLLGGPTYGEEHQLIEQKLRAVFFHELRHVWQRVQNTDDNIKAWVEPKTWPLQPSVPDTKPRIDILSEVDAFNIQSKYETKYIRSGTNESSNTTMKFRALDMQEKEEDEIQMEKARFLWYEYEYGTKDKIYRNNYGWKLK